MSSRIVTFLLSERLLGANPEIKTPLEQALKLRRIAALIVVGAASLIIASVVFNVRPMNFERLQGAFFILGAGTCFAAATVGILGFEPHRGSKDKGWTATQRSPRRICRRYKVLGPCGYFFSELLWLSCALIGFSGFFIVLAGYWTLLISTIMALILFPRLLTLAIVKAASSIAVRHLQLLRCGVAVSVSTLAACLLCGLGLSAAQSFIGALVLACAAAEFVEFLRRAVASALLSDRYSKVSSQSVGSIFDRAAATWESAFFWGAAFVPTGSSS